MKQIQSIAKEIFKTSFVTYCIFVLAEVILGGFVTDYFNMNILLGVVIVSGLLSSKEPIAHEAQKDMFWQAIFACVVGLIVYLKIQNLDFSIVVSILASIVSFLLALLLSS